MQSTQDAESVVQLTHQQFLYTRMIYFTWTVTHITLCLLI